jgi:thiol-disulfide isomerase/thioredoxin
MPLAPKGQGYTMNEAARVRAAELPKNLKWFNTKEPISLASQRGKVVLLNFWTSSSINCMHALPDLRYLEKKYPQHLAVIGVHSPKFANERDPEQLRKAIGRHHVRHPVVNDPEFYLWRAYGIKAWPSAVLIDTHGYVLGVLRGEGRRQQLDDLIGAKITQAESKGWLVAAPSVQARIPEPRTTLYFPGKVLASQHSLYIADSGRNRVLHTYHDGKIRRVFGSGTAGLVDGRETEAMFDNPQGMTIVGDYLYVADAGNHAIRRIHLKSGEVVTVAGTGKQGRYEGETFRDPLEAQLNSPWDLAYDDSNLYVAMTGQHQVWRMSLSHPGIERFAGSGREDIEDGSRTTACFAQPSAVACHDRQLFVLDAQASALRTLRFSGESVSTLVGMGLFEYGDRDGVGREARLQYPLGLAVDRARKELWIADTFNSRIRRMNLATRTVEHFDFKHPLDEPRGLTLYGDKLFVANTNAHQIVAVDLDTRAAEVLDVREG